VLGTAKWRGNKIMATTKNLLEDLIATERAMERALCRMLTAAGAFDAKGDKGVAEAVMREYRDVDQARDTVRHSKGRLQALFEHKPVVPRGTKCDGDHAEPICADENCWLRDRSLRIGRLHERH
jgi:hypothetical protein